jgi:hypothetical protein
MLFSARIRRSATLALGVLALLLVTAVTPPGGPAPAQAAPLAAPTDGSIRTVAGTGAFALFADGIAATAATIARSTGVAVLPGGGFLIAAHGAHCVLKVDAAGLITTVAGTCTTTSTSTSAGDGLLATAPGVTLNGPGHVTALAGGGFLISEETSGCVRKVDSARIISTVAGICGQPGFNGASGTATATRLQRPQATVALTGGAFMVADFDNGCVRAVTSRGAISTVAGICGTLAMGADGPAATASALGGPVGLAALPDGGFVLTEYFANRVRRVTPDGRITTIAGSGPFAFGTGTGSFAGDGGPALEAKLNGPTAVVPAAGGGYLISDAENNRIRWVLPDQPATIRTLAGTGPSGFGLGGFDGDGGFPATRQLNRPMAMAVTPDGGVLFADQLNRRIRAIAPLAIQNTRLPFVQVLSPVGGPATVGGRLQCQAGDWSATVVGFRYTWLVGGRPTTHTGQTLLPSPDMAGQPVACRVTGSTYSATLTVDSVGQTVQAPAVGIDRPKDMTITVTGQGTVYARDPVFAYANACPPTCTFSVPEGTELDLYAGPADGWTLKSWAGPCVAGSGVDCFVTMDTSQRVTAEFVPKPKLTVKVLGNGTVTDDAGFIACGPNATCVFPQDYEAANFLTGSSPVQWQGCTATFDDGTCATLTASDQTVTATFGAAAAVRSGAAPRAVADGSADAPPRDFPAPPAPIYVRVEIVNLGGANGYAVLRFTNIFPELNAECFSDDPCLFELRNPGPHLLDIWARGRGNGAELVKVTGCPSGSAWRCTFDGRSLTANTTITFTFGQRPELQVFLSPNPGLLEPRPGRVDSGDTNPAIACSIFFEFSNVTVVAPGCSGRVKSLRPATLVPSSNPCWGTAHLSEVVQVTHPVPAPDGKHWVRHRDGSLVLRIYDPTKVKVIFYAGGCAGTG